MTYNCFTINKKGVRTISYNIKLFEFAVDNHSKEELLDIYWNIADNVWDRRIGRKPTYFDSLPNEPTMFHKRSKSEVLKPYIQRIESMTSEKERRKYLMVNIQKCLTASEFEEWWSDLATVQAMRLK